MNEKLLLSESPMSLIYLCDFFTSLINLSTWYSYKSIPSMNRCRFYGCFHIVSDKTLCTGLVIIHTIIFLPHVLNIVIYNFQFLCHVEVWKRLLMFINFFSKALRSLDLPTHMTWCNLSFCCSILPTDNVFMHLKPNPSSPIRLFLGTFTSLNIIEWVSGLNS